MANSREIASLTTNFPAANAGEQMGWVNVYDINADTSRAHVITATFGEDSTVTTIRQQDGEADPHNVQVITGFEGVRSFDIVFWRDEDDPAIHHSIAQEITFPLTSEGRIVTSLWAGQEMAPRTNCAEDKKGVIHLIKNGLDRIGRSDFYPEVYYGLNGRLGHPSGPGLEAISPEERRDLFYPDPIMIRSTSELVGQAAAIEFVLESELLEDAAMLAELENAGALNISELASVFSASRKDISRREEYVISAIKDWLFKDFVYKPLGYRRRRPYIDPTDPSDYMKLVVQSALAQGREQPAHEQLFDERDELRHRLAFASAGLHTLKGLLAAEMLAAA